MLNKEDLQKIEKLLDQKLKGEREYSDHNLAQRLKSEREYSDHNLAQRLKSEREYSDHNLAQRLKSEREHFDRQLKSELKPLKSDLAKVRRDATVIVDFFDREYLGLRARVERIESVLHLPPLPEE